MTPDSSDSSNESTRNKFYEAHLGSSPHTLGAIFQGGQNRLRISEIHSKINNMYLHCIFLYL